MKRILSTLTTVALVSTGAVILLGPAATSAGPEAREKTKFAFVGAGYGTRLRGGEVPAGSDTTSYEAIGCTNVTGKNNNNHVTEATLPGVGTAYEVTTDVWTSGAKGVESSNTRSSVERVVIGDPATTGTLELNAVSTVTRASHSDKGFAAKTVSRVGSILYTDATGAQQELEIPTPGEPIEIPGLATLTVGSKVEKTDNSGARAEGAALVLDVVATGSRLKVAHAFSEISDDIKHGLFKGQSFAVQGKALQDNVSLGRQPLSLMPCAGTEGDLLTKSLASAALGENGEARGLTSRLLSDQTAKAAFGHARGRVEAFTFGGDDQIAAENVVGRVNVWRNGNKLKRDIDGTKIGEVSVNGEAQEFPDSDVIEIPGVVKLERNLVTQVPGGLKVTALRITLLDGSGAVIDLGEAKLIVRDAGL